MTTFKNIKRGNFYLTFLSFAFIFGCASETDFSQSRVQEKELAKADEEPKTKAANAEALEVSKPAKKSKPEPSQNPIIATRTILEKDLIGILEQEDDSQRFTKINKWAQQSFQLTIQTNDSTSITKDRLEFIFLLDNSRSMQPNIDLLNKAIKENFIGKLNAEKVKFNIRFLTLSMIEWATRDGKFRVPRTLGGSHYNFNPCSIEIPEEFKSLDKVKVFTEENTEAEIAAYLEQVANLSKSCNFQNEPGICLAMDYMHWLDQNRETKDSTLWSPKGAHFVMLTNENNSLKFQEFKNFDGTLNREYGLKCGKIETPPTKVKENQCHTPKSPMELYQKELADYQEDFKGYQEELDRCDGDLTRYKVFGNKFCVTPHYKCEKEASTRYICKAGNYTSGLIKQNKEAQNKSRCQVYKKFKCTGEIDGVKTDVIVNRNDAHEITKNGSGTCQPIPSEGTSSYDRSGSNSVFGLVSGSCNAYDCSIADRPNEIKKGLHSHEISDPKYFNCQVMVDDDHEEKLLFGDFTSNGKAEVNIDSCDEGEIKNIRPYEISRLKYLCESQLTESIKNNYEVDSWKISLTRPTEPSVPSDTSAAKEVCKEVEVEKPGKTELLEPTPENFERLLKHLSPGSGAKWHSIISKSDKPCEGQTDGLFSIGLDYQALSNNTVGIEQDICSPSFNSFVDKLAKIAIYQKIKQYKIPEAARDVLTDAQVFIVHENGAILTEENYSLEGGFIHFNEKSIKEGDVFNVLIKGKQSTESVLPKP